MHSKIIKIFILISASSAITNSIAQVTDHPHVFNTRIFPANKTDTNCSIELTSEILGKIIINTQSPGFHIPIKYTTLPENNDIIYIKGKEANYPKCDIVDTRTSLNLLIKQKWYAITKGQEPMTGCVNKSLQISNAADLMHPDFDQKILIPPNSDAAKNIIDFCQFLSNMELTVNKPCKVRENGKEYESYCNDDFIRKDIPDEPLSYADVINLGLRDKSIIGINSFEKPSSKEERHKMLAAELAKKTKFEQEETERKWLASPEGKKYLAEQERQKNAAANLRKKQDLSFKMCETKIRDKYDIYLTDSYGRETSRRTVALSAPPNIYPPGKYGKNSYFIFFVIQSVVIKGVPADKSYSFYTDCIIDQDKNIIGIERAQH